MNNAAPNISMEVDTVNMFNYLGVEIKIGYPNI
jgi:hypothetical protein